MSEMDRSNACHRGECDQCTNSRCRHECHRRNRKAVPDGR